MLTPAEDRQFNYDVATAARQGRGHDSRMVTGAQSHPEAPRTTQPPPHHRPRPTKPHSPSVIPCPIRRGLLSLLSLSTPCQVAFFLFPGLLLILLILEHSKKLVVNPGGHL